MMRVPVARMNTVEPESIDLRISLNSCCSICSRGTGFTEAGLGSVDIPISVPSRNFQLTSLDVTLAESTNELDVHIEYKTRPISSGVLPLELSESATSAAR